MKKEAITETVYNINESKDLKGIGHMYVLETITLQDGKVVDRTKSEPSYLAIILSKFERAIMLKNLNV